MVNRTIVVVGEGALEVRVIDVVSVVVHHVEHHVDARLVQRLHHLLELAYAAEGVGGVGAVGAFGHVVVHGVVAPVVLWLVELRLVHRPEVVRRQDMHGVDAQLLQVADGPRLGEREILSGMLGIGACDGEVAVVHLIHHPVGKAGGVGATVVYPSLGVAVAQVYHHASLSVHRHRLGEDARRCLSVHHDLVFLAFQVAFYGGLVDASLGHQRVVDGGIPFHLHAVAVHHHEAPCVAGGEDLEHGLRGRVVHLVEPIGFVFLWVASHYYHGCCHRCCQ